MTSKTILLLPGDGIGPEVVAQARRVLDWSARAAGITFVYDEALIGGSAYDAVGTPFPAETLEKAKKADAISILRPSFMLNKDTPEGNTIQVLFC